jgi:hypothetical protein
MGLVEVANMAASGAKAPRGTAGAFYAVDRYDFAALMGADTEVVRGKDAKIDVAIADLPPNADVQSCVMELYSTDADSAPDAQTTGVSIEKKGDTTASGNFTVAVSQPVRASNVRVMLGEELVWTTGGPLTELSYSLPDASAAVNAFLDKQKGATAPFKTLPFIVKSDTSGKVGLRVVSLSFSQVKTQSWPNPLDKSVRNDRTHEVGFGAVVSLSLDPLIDRPEVAVGLKAISFDLDGKFDSDRLLAQVEVHDGREFATVNTEYSIAQAFTLLGQQGSMLHSPVNCTGVAACVSVDAAAELYAEIQGDENGAPAAGTPLGNGTVSVTPPAAGAEAIPWVAVKFSSAIQLDVDKSYWLVLKAVQGSADVALIAATGTEAGAEAFARDRLCVSRASLVWKDFTRDASSGRVAMAGVVYKPAKDDQTAAAKVVMSGAPQSDLAMLAAVDPVTKTQTYSYDIADADWRRTLLELRCYASGTLHVANVVQRFRLK